MGAKLSTFNFSSGYTVDIGSEKHTSYEKEWNIELKNLINIDIDIEGNPNILADINNLPFKNYSISNFGCFNVLELVQFPKIAIDEIYRVLHKSGYLVGYVPFLYPIHNQPVDYWRFSNKSLYNILKDGGFENIIIEPLGGRFIVMYDIILPKKLFFIRFTLSLLSIALNMLYEMFHSKQYNREMYPSGYFFYAKK
tara:strand:- start:452 stop:1039 length:588 start_codon:yes stop_codon:yes gene_type:complete